MAGYPESDASAYRISTRIIINAFLSLLICFLVIVSLQIESIVVADVFPDQPLAFADLLDRISRTEEAAAAVVIMAAATSSKGIAEAASHNARVYVSGCDHPIQHGF